MSPTPLFIVTGGAGFIGSNVIRGLNRRGIDRILVVDDMQDGHKHRSLSSLEFLDLVDYRDFIDDLERLEDERMGAVLHLGACSDTMVHDGRFMLRVNYEYSKRLIDFALGRCPFIGASSASVYGDGTRGFREAPECELPLNVYAFSKFLVDRHMRRLLPLAPSQLVNLRYFNVYGPQENHKGRMASVVFQFDRQLRAKGSLEIFEGSEEFRRDFVFVDDAVDVNLFFLDHPEISGIFNCGSGRAESFMDLARELASHHEGASIAQIPFPEELQGKYQAYTCADLSELRRAGYEREFTSIAEGVASYVRVLGEGDGYYREPQRS